MTETTEEKDPIELAKSHIGSLHGFSEYCDYLYSRQGHTSPAGDFLCAISKLVNSLTEERDELKDRNDKLEKRDRHPSHRFEPEQYVCACTRSEWNHLTYFGSCPHCEEKYRTPEQALNGLEEENKAYIKFKKSVLNSIKDCREVEPNLATCFENTCGIIELESFLNKSKGEEE